MRRTASGTCAARSPTRKNDPRARRAARRSRTRGVQSRSGPSSKVSATRRAAWLPRHTQPSVSTWAPHAYAAVGWAERLEDRGNDPLGRVAPSNPADPRAQPLEEVRIVERAVEQMNELEVGARDERDSCPGGEVRSEKHTSELQSPCNLVCRILFVKT